MLVGTGSVANTAPLVSSAPLNVALLGHSFTVQAYASATSDAPRGLAYWVGMLSGQRLRFDFSRVFGLAGDTSGPLDGSRPGFTSRLPAALQSNADVIIVSDPTNDFAAGVAYATTVANMAQIFTAIRSAGKICCTWAPTPRGAPNGLSASGLLLQARYAQWLKANAKTFGVIYADASLALSDPSLTGFDYAAGMAVADDLHLAIPGARSLGLALTNALLPSLPVADQLTYSSADLYDATNNPNGNLLANATMAGTAGTTSANGATVSGSVATSWQLLISNGAGLTVTASIVTTGGRRMQQIQFSGTPTAGNPAIWIRQTPTFSSQIAQGDSLQALGYAELDAGSSGITGFGIEQWIVDGGSSHAMRTGNSVGSLTNGSFPTDAFSGVHRTMLNLTGPSPTSFYAQYGAQGVNGTAMSGTMRWANLEIRKNG